MCPLAVADHSQVESAEKPATQEEVVDTLVWPSLDSTDTRSVAVADDEGRLIQHKILIKLEAQRQLSVTRDVPHLSAVRQLGTLLGAWNDRILK